MYPTKTVLILSLLIISLFLSSLPGTVNSQIHPQSCLTYEGCDLITCNPNGGYTYTFAVTNKSAFAATEAEFRFVTPSGMTITPNPYPLVPALLPNQTRQISVTIGPGMPAERRSALRSASTIRKT